MEEKRQVTFQTVYKTTNQGKEEKEQSINDKLRERKHEKHKNFEVKCRLTFMSHDLIKSLCHPCYNGTIFGIQGCLNVAESRETITKHPGKGNSSLTMTLFALSCTFVLFSSLYLQMHIIYLLLSHLTNHCVSF